MTRRVSNPVKRVTSGGPTADHRSRAPPSTTDPIATRAAVPPRPHAAGAGPDGDDILGDSGEPGFIATWNSPPADVRQRGLQSADADFQRGDHVAGAPDVRCRRGVTTGALSRREPGPPAHRPGDHVAGTSNVRCRRGYGRRARPTRAGDTPKAPRTRRTSSGPVRPRPRSRPRSAARNRRGYS